MKKYFFVIIFLCNSIFAQSTDDALRFSLSGIGVNSRALGMGNAFVGVADNFSATYWNPAGLAQLKTIEVTGGLNFRSYLNKTTFQQNLSEENKSDFSLDDFGFVLPIPTTRGSLVFAFGYTNITDHTRIMSFNGFNSLSSIIPVLYDADAKYDIPFQIFLSNKKGYSPITSKVSQVGDVYEEGNGGQWNFSGAVDVDENISVGATIYGTSGNYSSQREYSESDRDNLWNDTTSTFPSDSLYRQFKQFNLTNFISTEYSGAGLILGFMIRGESFKIGATIKQPFQIDVKEAYTDEGTSYFDYKSNKGPYKYTAKSEYGIKAPTTFAGGISIIPFSDFTLSADVEFTDWTKLKWADNSTLEIENSIFREKFRSITNVRYGFEFYLTDLIQVRGGYINEKSPFKNDPKNYDPITVTGGIGYKISPKITIDAAIASKKFSTYHNNYSHPTIDNPSRTDEEINVTYVNLTLSYRL
ncbi:MAG: outer membrane protein transport protein [Bacteroidetes bacterium]|nr:outer membrane protein transport protein [Bacteroidota bacterium]